MAETIISPGVYQRENDISFIQPAATAVGAAFVGPTVKGPVEDPVTVTSYSQYQRVFGDVFVSGSTKKEFLTSLAVKSYFEQGGDTALVARVVSGSFTPAVNTFVSASVKTGSQPFTLETLGKGTIYNNSGSLNADGSLVSGSADNIRWEVSGVNNSSGQFSLSIRRGDDNTKGKIILETFNNISLDPNSDRYIERVIGNQRKVKRTDGTSIILDVEGEYPNKSSYVRVASVGFPTLDYLSTDGITVRADSAGISYSGSLPIVSSGSFITATGAIAIGGASYFGNISGSATQAQGLVAANYTDVLSILSNQDDYRFNIISTPGLTYDGFSSTLDTVVSLAETRGDCVAVVDLVGYKSALTEATTEAAGINSSYAAAYWPWVQIPTATGKNEFVPASVIIPGVYAFTDKAGAPWFAPAGLVRGGIPNVIQAERKLSKDERGTIYSANINPIATFPTQGVSVYGQKTLQKKASALDRVNVRRLMIELKEFIGNVANTLVFEQNTITTRNKFTSAVNPYLDNVVQRQGLYAYRVVMDETNNTADVIDRNQLVGQIQIQPTRTAEFILLDFTLEPTGATFS